MSLWGGRDTDVAVAVAFHLRDEYLRVDGNVRFGRKIDGVRTLYPRSKVYRR